MRVLLISGLLLLTVLAGCAEEASDEAPDSVDDATGGDGGNATADPGVADNGTASGDIADNVTAPVAALTASVVNGTAPLTVNFTIEASNATSWSLDYGDGNATNGTSFPATVDHTFEAGTFNVSLLVTGDGGEAYQNTTIDVAAAAADEIVLEPFEETVSLDLPCPGCDQGTLTCTWRQHSVDDAQDCAWIDFPDELAGQPFTLTGNGLDPDVLFWTSCEGDTSSRFTEDLSEESGVIPADAGCALVWEKVDFLIDVTLTITPE